MEINWIITEKDIQKVKAVVEQNNNAFVKIRRNRNVKKVGVIIDRNTVIKTMLMCLLTSQQRSGPESKIGQFLRINPFPLTFEIICEKIDLEKYIQQILMEHDLKRYINRISNFFSQNIQKIQANDWNIIEELRDLNEVDSKLEERKIADKLAETYKGFGPKQSRNFLQALGLTKYEIPIDSRITNWLNHFGFPVSLSSSPLGDNGYYHFVSDGIHELCTKAGTFPCILDAAIFSSFDNEEWNEDNAIF